MRHVKFLLVIAASLALLACGNKGGTTGSGVISLNGGAGGSAKGGDGGLITTFSNSTSMVHGDLRLHATGTVDASFTVPNVTPDFGANKVTLNTGPTKVQFVNFTTASNLPLPPVGTFYVSNNDTALHVVTAATDGSTNKVTGLEVPVGATLQLAKNTSLQSFTEIPGAVVINGTVTNVSAGESLDLRSGSFLQIASGGKVTTTPASGGSGQLSLSSGGVLINLGTIESNGAAGGASGGVTLSATTFLYNIGTVNAKGDSSGNGGAIQLQAAQASVFTSGTIDASGGNSGSIAFAGGSTGIGRVVVGGTVTGNGSSSGGKGGAVTLKSSSGGILVNATITAKGGSGTAGGDGGSLQLVNNVSSDLATLHQVSPEGIKVAGSITLEGGKGDGQGGKGGTISLASGIAGSALPGFGNVEFFGYQSITLNGGASTGGSGGDGGTVAAALSAPSLIVNVAIPAGGVFNEVPISVRGGDNSPNQQAKSAGGGKGGSLQFTTPQAGDASDPARTLVTSSGAIDISGGAGTTGGTAGSVTMSGYGPVANSGSITARGGTGTTQGGDGSVLVQLLSSGSVANSGAIAVSGGDGGNGGKGGSVTIKSGNQTTTTTITASGGNGTTGNGGNGGKIVLFSEFATTSRGSLNVAKGSGGSATNGTVTVDGSSLQIPSGGVI